MTSSTAPITTYSANLQEPSTLAVGPDGKIYVPNQFSNVIWEFGSGSQQGSLSGSLYYPGNIAVDGAGNVVVTNYYYNYYSSVGVYENGTAPTVEFKAGATVQLPDALQVAFDSSGNLFLTQNNLVEKLSGTGSVLWSQSVYLPSAIATDASGNVFVAGSDNTVREFHTDGTAGVVLSNGVSTPNALAVDAAGDVFVANYHSVEEFSSAGALIGSTSVQHPTSVAVDTKGHLYVAFSDSNSVIEYDTSTTTWSTVRTLTQGLNKPMQIALDSSGNIYVASYANNSVVEYAADSSAASGGGSSSNSGGTSGNDTFIGGTGKTIDGGAGVDTMVYSDAASSHTITQNADGSWTVGNDTLVNIERLQFSDTKIALDLTGDAGQCYRLYQAAFDRTPDVGGLSYWIGQEDAGQALIDIANAFIGSAEFIKYSKYTDQQFVDLLYQNILHRAGDSGGIAYWNGQLDTSAQTRAQVLVGFSESPENQADVIQSISGGIKYDPAPTITTGAPSLSLSNASSYSLTTWQISGISISDVAAGSGTIQASLTDASGLLSVTPNPSALTSSGNGTAALTLSGSLSAVNLALSTLTDQNTATGENDIGIIVLDTGTQMTGTGTEKVMIASASNTTFTPVVNASGAMTLTQSNVMIYSANTWQISGLSLSGVPSGTTITMQLSDTNGQLSVTPNPGDGLVTSGEGSTQLSISGSQAILNMALGTLTDHDTVAGADLIHVTLVGFPNSASIPLTVTPT